MTKKGHILFISILSILVVASSVILYYLGSSYFRVPLEERYFHPDHQSLKSSGTIGHGLGIIGSLLMIIGVTSYMARKRYRFLLRLGLLKHWLEFHIFLCTLGPLLVLSHTTFKFGGIVAISFWSMVAVFLSGIIGRFIYIQIPRSIEGRELSLNEIRAMKMDIDRTIRDNHNLDEETIAVIENSISKSSNDEMQAGGFSLKSDYFSSVQKIRKIKSVLNREKLSKEDTRKILSLVKNEISMNNKIARLNMMQNLFRYWHVAHLPFALVMLIIMVIHVIVTITFGYHWIF